MMFRNRQHAAELLADRLTDYKGLSPLILAIPRGATPMAKHIADKLGGDLDVVLVRKLSAPDNPELAIGSVGESGEVYRDQELSNSIPEDYVQNEVKRQIEQLRQRRKLYSRAFKAHSFKDRTVIIVDDGVATGATMLAAIHEVRSQKPTKIIVAAAVASPSTATHLEAEADQVVLLDRPNNFYAVGQFFHDFSQVSDEEVVKILSN